MLVMVLFQVLMRKQDFIFLNQLVHVVERNAVRHKIVNQEGLEIENITTIAQIANVENLIL